MTAIQGRVKKWGNSFAIVIPAEIIQRDKIKENEVVHLLMRRKNSAKVLHETFGMGKGKLTKSGQQIKDELRRELYND
ncbi:AbrB/MazE/SpoVT family DNA-binding domain-containing protein [Candidatus Pacearchaeota archaeon]|nr:AbrB/MazE/SpoVT family DNA-binding domain-containing protein [Candidatus Pacearchaeota archaeon]